MTLLYVGALTDMFPVFTKSSLHKNFIYVDGLPKSNYFRNCLGEKISKDVQTLIQSIKTGLMTCYKSHKTFPKDDLTVFHTKGGQDIYYFYNTYDIDMDKNEKLRLMLPDVESLYLHGYLPKINCSLPNLQTIYHTSNFSNSEIIEIFPYDTSHVQKKITLDIEDDDAGEGFYKILTHCSDCSEWISIKTDFP